MDLFNIETVEAAKKEQVVTKISKSDIYLYEKCPLILWKKNKFPNKYKFSIKNKNTLIGIRAHELIQKAIEEKYTKNKNVKFSSRITDPAVKYEAKKIADNFLYYLENEIIEDGEVIGAEESLEKRIDKLNITLKGIIDLLIIKESEHYGTYVHVIDFKRKFFKNYLDNEALIYAYLVGEIYGLPVLFERISIEDKKTFQNFFYASDLSDAYEDVLEYLEKIVKELETDEEPIANPSVENCSECPFYHECVKEASDEYEKIKLEGIQDPKSLVVEIQKLKVIESFRKDLENELKDFLLQNEIDDLEFDDIGVEAKINVSKYASLGRKVPKTKVVTELLEKGLIPKEKYPLLSLKVDDFLDEIKEAFDLDDKDVKYVERKSLSLKVNNKKKDKK